MADQPTDPADLMAACKDDASCARALDHLHEFLDGECGTDLEDAIRTHLDECPACLDRHSFESALRVIIATRCKDAAPAGLLSRVRTTLEARAARGA